MLPNGFLASRYEKIFDGSNKSAFEHSVDCVWDAKEKQAKLLQFNLFLERKCELMEDQGDIEVVGTVVLNEPKVGKKERETDRQRQRDRTLT